MQELLERLIEANLVSLVGFNPSEWTCLAKMAGCLAICRSKIDKFPMGYRPGSQMRLD